MSQQDNNIGTVHTIQERAEYDVPALTAFLDQVFHSREEDESILTWISRGHPTYPVPLAYLAKTLPRTGEARALYYSTSTSRPMPDKSLRNLAAQFIAQHSVVLDDLGTKIDIESLPAALRKPSYIIESSPGNFQYGYVFPEPIEELEQAKAFIRLIYDSGFTDSGGAMPTKLVRLPGGYNGKPEHKGFQVRLVEATWVHWTPQELLTACNCAVTWEQVQADASEAIKHRHARSVAPWSSFHPAYPNLDGTADEVLEWLSENDKVQQDGGWVTIRCPWEGEHQSGGVTAGYKPLGRGEEPLLRGFHCFHDHCQNKGISDLLKWVVKEGGPEAPAQTHFKSLAAEWVYNPADNVGMQVWGDRTTHRPVSVGAMRNLFASPFWTYNIRGKRVKLSPTDEWLRSPSIVHVDGATKDPSTLTPLVRYDGVLLVNDYRPPRFGARPNGHESIDMFDAFLHYLIPNEFEYEYFLDSLALKVRNPAFRGCGIVMVAPHQGTGRGTLASLISILMGTGNTTSVTFDKLIGKAEFNEWQTSPWVFINETKDLADKNFYRAYERLKGLIEIQPTEALINYKGAQVVTRMVYSKYMLFSNHVDALAVASDDRRLFVIRNPQIPAPPEYFVRLNNWMNKKDWAPEVYHWLCNRQFDEARLMAPAPSTQGKIEMLEATRSPLEIAVHGCLSAHQGRFVVVAMVIDVLLALGDRLGIANPEHVRRLGAQLVRAESTGLDGGYRITPHGYARARPRLLKAHATNDNMEKLCGVNREWWPRDVTIEVEQNTHADLLQATSDALALHDR